VKGCSSLQALAGNAVQGEDLEWLQDAQQVLNSLDKHKAMSAVKDLLSLVILYVHGGFYFDTTLEFAESHKHLLREVGGVRQRIKDKEEVLEPLDEDSIQEGLLASLAATCKTLRVPRICNKDGVAAKVTHQPLLQTGSSISTGGHAAIPGFTVPHIDCWALYCPKGDKAMGLAFRSYVSRCNRMGLYQGGAPSNFAALSGDALLADKGAGGREGRNTLIGNLILRSLYDGIMVTYDADTLAEVEKYTWKSVEIPGKCDFVEELGMVKFYRGTWRGVALS
jgi:hypothetical protein